MCLDILSQGIVTPSRSASYISFPGLIESQLTTRASFEWSLVMTHGPTRVLVKECILRVPGVVLQPAWM